jgi:hypothetical protein
MLTLAGVDVITALAVVAACASVPTDVDLINAVVAAVTDVFVVDVDADVVVLGLVEIIDRFALSEHEQHSV